MKSKAPREIVFEDIRFTDTDGFWLAERPNPKNRRFKTMYTEAEINGMNLYHVYGLSINGYLEFRFATYGV
jgi:hypothetical protein